VVLAGVVIGSVFTTIYALRFLWGAFARKGSHGPTTLVANLHRPSASFLVAPAILAAAGLFFGVLPRYLDTALDGYAGTMPAAGADDGHYTLALWHGVNLPLVLSALVLAVGIGAFFSRERLRRAGLGSWLPLGNADRIYDAVIRGADLASIRLTAVTQRGSIPVTQSVILATLVLFPVAVLAFGATDHPQFRLWDSLVQPVVGLLIVTAAVAATIMRNRLAAVLLVGITGYGCGAIFAFHGAPDLALTQFLVETLTLVIFVLVLRTLPAEAEEAKRHRRWPSAPPSPRWRCSRWPPAPARASPNCCRMPPMTGATARTPSTCCWSTSVPGTPSARSRSWWLPPPASHRWCSATAGSARRRGCPMPANPISANCPRRSTARPSVTPPGCGAANCATRATAPWSSRSPPA
jgi:uncharacterized MnhB-related membrane protein